MKTGLSVGQSTASSQVHGNDSQPTFLSYNLYGFCRHLSPDTVSQVESTFVEKLLPAVHDKVKLQVMFKIEKVSHFSSQPMPGVQVLAIATC